MAALGKILVATYNGYDSKAFFSDGDEIIIQVYAGTERKYFCGREYDYPKEIIYEPHLLVVADAQEATIGMTDSVHITILWSDTSLVPRKHRHGGQSQARFQRGREEVLKNWLREIAEKVILYSTDKDIIVGGPGMTKNLLIEELPTDVRNRISRIDSVGYTDENGLWELIGKSRYV